MRCFESGDRLVTALSASRAKSRDHPAHTSTCEGNIWGPPRGRRNARPRVACSAGSIAHSDRGQIRLRSRRSGARTTQSASAIIHPFIRLFSGLPSRHRNPELCASLVSGFANPAHVFEKRSINNKLVTCLYAIVSEQQPITLDTALSLTQVCTLLRRLGNTHVSPSGISYYGSKTADFEALVPPSKRGGTDGIKDCIR